MNNQRYRQYHQLTADTYNMNEGADDPESVVPRKKWNLKRMLCILAIIILVLAVLAFLAAFVVFPLVFKFSVSLQQKLVFTRFNLLTNTTAFYKYRYPEFRNIYIDVKDLDDSTSLKLGAWHLLPLELAEIAIYTKNYDYEAALKNSSYSVLLYFHGTGEDRSQNLQKYQLLRQFFHVISIDYRGYGDSEKGPMFENNIVNDCKQVLSWLRNRTDSPIYFWGHSLGTALATRTLAESKSDVEGLVLESSFTSFRDELYNHPYMKYFKWLPWFELTVVQPLIDNGFIFDTAKHVLNVACPIMFLHSADDSIVPYSMSEKLYDISQTRDVNDSVKEKTVLYIFGARLGLNHYFIYKDPYTLFYIFDFLKRTGNVPQLSKRSNRS